MRKPASKSTKSITAEQLETLKYNAAGILAEARKSVLVRFPFVGSIAMSLDLVPVRDCRISTMATDGQCLYCDIDFLSTLSPEDKIFIIAHEIYHCVMLHLVRLENRDHKLFNIATDIEVNEILKADGLSIPKGGMSAATFGFKPGLSAEEYYDRLLERENNNPGSTERYLEASKLGSGAAKINEQLTGQFDSHIYKDEELPEKGDENQQDKFGKIGYDPDYRPNVKASNVERIREAAVAAAQMIAQRGGHLPDYLQKIISNLLEPKLNWKEVLASFVSKVNGDKRTWNRCNRRFISSRMYLPSSYNDKLKIAIGVDTSGSVFDMLQKFLSEIKGIVSNFEYEITLIQCDTDVRHVEQYNESNPLDLSENTDFRVHGCGGTMLKPIFKYIEDNNIDIDACIVLTDGECEMFKPEDAKEFPVLWCVTKGGCTNTLGFGEIIELD